MLTSIANFDLYRIIAAERLHRPSPLAHLGLEIHTTYLPTFVKEMYAPAFEEDNIVMQIGHSTRISGHILKNFEMSVQPGTLFIIPRGIPSEWRVKYPCEVMNIFPSRQFLQAIALELSDNDPSRVEFMPKIGSVDLMASTIAQALLHTLQQASLNTLLAAETLAHSLMVHLIRTHTTHKCLIPNPSRLSYPQIKQVLKYIHSYLTYPLTLHDLAAIVHLSPYHFARQFRATFGQTPYQYILQQRLIAARLLIEQKKLPLADIAAQLGFADQSHLNFHFKRRYKVTPGALVRG